MLRYSHKRYHVEKDGAYLKNRYALLC